VVSKSPPASLTALEAGDGRSQPLRQPSSQANTAADDIAARDIPADDFFTRLHQPNVNTAALQQSFPGEQMDGIISTTDTLVAVTGYSSSTYPSQQNGYPSDSLLPPLFRSQDPTCSASAPLNRPQGFSSASLPHYPHPSLYRYVQDSSDRTQMWMSQGGRGRGRGH